MSTVSHGTHRAEDLIPAFLAELGARDPRAKAELEGEYKAALAHWTDAAGYFIVEAIFDALDAVAPAGTYFGAHPGDGSDFGYWPLEDDAAA